MARSEILALIGKGRAITAEDIEEIRAQLTQVPPEQYDDAAGWAWEAVALIVNDPAYEGDAQVPA